MCNYAKLRRIIKDAWLCCTLCISKKSYHQILQAIQMNLSATVQVILQTVVLQYTVTDKTTTDDGPLLQLHLEPPTTSLPHSLPTGNIALLQAGKSLAHPHPTSQDKEAPGAWHGHQSRSGDVPPARERSEDADAGDGRLGGGGAGVAAVGGGGDQLHGGRREGVEPQGGLHLLGEEAPSLLQGRLAPVRVPEWAVGRGAGGRGRVRQLRQGERHQQPQQGNQLRVPAQGGQGLLLHLQLRLLLLRHEARRHRQEGPCLFLPRLIVVVVLLLLLAGRQVILQIRRRAHCRPQRRSPRRRRGRRRHATQDALIS